MIDVHVNGRPLQPPATPLVERSRVLLPLRTVFTALVPRSMRREASSTSSPYRYALS